MKTARLFLIGALALATAACDGILGGDDDNFNFTAQQTTYEEGMVNSADVRALLRNIDVTGIFLLPHPCHALRANLNRVGGQVEVTIIASPTSTTCPAAIHAMSYRLQTLGFARGLYRVSVYHEITGSPRQFIVQEDVSLD